MGQPIIPVQRMVIDFVTVYVDKAQTKTKSKFHELTEVTVGYTSHRKLSMAFCFQFITQKCIQVEIDPFSIMVEIYLNLSLKFINFKHVSRERI